MRAYSLLLLTTLAACAESRSVPYYQGSDEGVGELKSVGQSGPSLRPEGGAPSVQLGRGSYPKGPYGSDDPSPGERLPNLELYGLLGDGAFRVGRKGELGVIGLDELRKTDHSHLILHVGALWCSSSWRSAADLGRYSAELDAAGGLVIEALVDGQATEVDPSVDDLRAWRETVGAGIPTLSGSDERFRAVFPGYEHAYIIDLDTMVVEWHGSGASPDQSIADAVARAFLSRPEL